MDATITISCDYCSVAAVYKPSAIRVTAFTHGVVVMEFFCVKCREENRREINLDLAEHLALVGVTATVVRTPLELMEQPMVEDPITEADVDEIAGMSMDVFNRLMEREEGRGV